MSLFDPFSLYVHRQVNTKKGQVIQKKPYVNDNQAVSPDQVKESVKILLNLGYYIFPPQAPPPTPIVSFDDLSFQFVNSIPAGTTQFTVNLREFLRSIYSQYSLASIFNLDYAPEKSTIVLNISSMRVLLNTNAYTSTSNPVALNIQYGNNNLNVVRYYSSSNANNNDTVCFGRNNVTCALSSTYLGNFTSSSSGYVTYSGTQPSPRAELSTVYSEQVGTYLGIKTNNWEGSDILANNILLGLSVSGTGSASGSISSLTLCGHLLIILGKGI